jgi:hypothetical protein
VGVTKLVIEGVRQGSKYAPAIAEVVRQVRGPATDYAKARLEAARSRRLAITKAASVTDGAVLEVLHGEQPVWVVFSGDEPIAQHPNTDVPLAALVAHANLDRRRAPEDFPTARERAAAARHRATAKLPHPRRRRSVPDADAELVGEGVDELDELRPAERRAPEAGEPERGHEPGP